MKLTIHESFEPCLYGKRDTIKKFINKAVSHFTGKNIVPTLAQVEDYVTADRWAKANISDGKIGYAEDGFEYIQLDDLCKNIQNLCSFNLDNIRESNATKHWYSLGIVEPPLAKDIRNYLCDNKIKYEEDKDGSNYSYEVYCDEEEYSSIKNVIDKSDWTYITKGTRLKFESVRYKGRYFVANEDCIPFGDQPENGYTAMGAVERAQREAEKASKMFGEPISETRTWFRILDSDFNTCPELEKGI